MFNLIIIFAANYLFLVSIFLYLLYLWKAEKKIRIAIFKLTLFSFPFIWLIGKLFSFIIFDPRPFVIEHVIPLIQHVADNGFPSDHTLLTMAIASIVIIYNKTLGMILFLIAFLVGTARVLALVHHPLDIIGSTVIATSITYCVFKITKKYFPGHAKI